jgi:hypothetical protein
MICWPATAGLGGDCERNSLLGKVRILHAGEHRLPACSVRQLAGRNFSTRAAFRCWFAASCKRQASSLCSPETCETRALSMICLP